MFSLNFLEVVKKKPKAIIPKKATDGSAGLDLYACIEKEITIKSGESALITSGVAMSIPKNHVGLIFIRSSLGIKCSICLLNSVGVIDSDYRGEIFIGLKNFGKQNYTIKPNDRIAQIVVVPFFSFCAKEVSLLDETKRSEGGLGSTGK